MQTHSDMGYIYLTRNRNCRAQRVIMPEKINEKLKARLYANAKRGQWDKVVEMYGEYKEAHNLILTPDDNTALHLAVIDNREETVEKLVEVICKSNQNYKKLLETTNKRENNPLHLAAVMGSVRMCHAIASAHDELVDKRNKVDETPMFLAAVYGNTNAFFCLYKFCGNNSSRITSNCRVKNDGDTVLHSALRNEHLELAFQLIHINCEAMNWITEDGITPLHVLASKPTSFKSGSQIRGWKNILYYCTFVDQLRPQSIEHLGKAWDQSMSEAKTAPSCFPNNYETCIDFITRLWDGFLKVSTFKSVFKGHEKDTSSAKDDEVQRVINKNEMNDTSLEKDVKVQSESLHTNESHDECLDTEPHPLANEPSIPNFPINYTTCINFFQFAFSAILIVLGFGSAEIKKMRQKKKKYTWSVQVMEKLLEFYELDKYDHDGKIPVLSEEETEVTLPYDLVDGEAQFSDDIVSRPKEPEKPKDVQATETAILLAAKNGVLEIVKGMFNHFPLAICDTRGDKKNVVLLAAEYRQPDVYKFLLKTKKNLFRAVDDNGNSALHLAAAAPKSMLWRISGATLQLQWEVNWYKFIEESMPLHFFAHYNNDGKNASTIFHDTHMDMVKKSGDWLTKTSKSGSVVAALVVTVAFTSAASIPGGFDQNSGAPLLETKQAFFIFAMFSLIALCLSSTSLTMFLAILTYRFDAKDFRSNLPIKLLIGISSLFFSIISMLISFCAGHYFLIHDSLRKGADVLYMLIFVPVALIFFVSKLPLYIDLLQAIFITVPNRSANAALYDPLVAPDPSKPLRMGKFEVTSIPIEVGSKALCLFTPTTNGSYHVIFFLPGCLESVYSDYLQLIASHGFLVIAPRLVISKAKETESASEVKAWLASDREMVEAELCKRAEVKQRETKFSITLTIGKERLSNPFSAVIGFDPPTGTKFSIPESQIQTQDPPSSNIPSPDVESQFVISKLTGTLERLLSDES